MMRFILASRTLVVALSLAGWAQTLPAAGPARNIVMMVTDDQGLDAGCYGNRDVKTPNLDRLAAEGTRFSHAFCTVSSCSPSRSVILTGLQTHTTGQYGLAHAVHHFYSHRWVRSLPVLLSQAGYRTCSIGKTHVEPEELYRFDEYANEGIEGGYRSSVQMAENAEKFLRGVGDRPFFLYICPTDPHRDFGNGRDYPGVTPVKYDPASLTVPPWLPDTPVTRRDLAEYYESVSRVDQGLGRLMQAIENTGHADDTLLIYLSDNGSPFPVAKTNMYEPSIRLPLVIRSPSQTKRGVVCNALATWADLTPTILEYAGVKPPEKPNRLQGRSLLGVLETENPPGWDEIYGSHTFHEVTMYYPMRMIRTRRYKCILNLAHPLPYPIAADLYHSPTWQDILARKATQIGNRTMDAYLHRPRYELYDLEADPSELHNLADDPGHAAVLKELQDKLRAWQTRTKDPWIVKYAYE